MYVEVDPFEDEAEEFGRVYEIMRSQGMCGRNKSDPPFYVSFNSREEKDPARQATGNSCLKCGEENHSARECPSKFINRSRRIHPAVADGTPQEAEARWRGWQRRLCQLALARAAKRTG